VTDTLLTAAFAIVAVLYSAVGQAGGTGYIAVMGLMGFGPEIVKPTALALNILVAFIACLHFYRAGLLTWRVCYPFGVLGVPFSLAGGTINLPAAVYQPFVGALLLLAAWQMFRTARGASDGEPRDPPFLLSLIAGGAIGFVSGITGVGGGIFLAPLVLTMGWIETRQASAVSATFNLLNSASALAGVWATSPALPAALPVWMMAVAAGALLGGWLGSRLLPPAALRLILAVLLLAAGLRMVAVHLI